MITGIYQHTIICQLHLNKHQLNLLELKKIKVDQSIIVIVHNFQSVSAGLKKLGWGI